jgi:hypothetical protein
LSGDTPADKAALAIPIGLRENSSTRAFYGAQGCTRVHKGANGAPHNPSKPPFITCQKAPSGETPEHQPTRQNSLSRAESQAQRAAEKDIQARISRMDADGNFFIRVNPRPSVVKDFCPSPYRPETGPALRAKADLSRRSA